MWREKQASRLLLEAGQKDVLDQLQEAQAIMEEAIGKASAAYEAKMEAENNCKDQIRDERQHFWEKVARSKATAEAKLESERRGFQAIIGPPEAEAK